MKLLLCRTKIRKGEIDAKFPVGYWSIGLLGYWFIGLLVCWFVGLLAEKKIQGQGKKQGCQ